MALKKKKLIRILKVFIFSVFLCSIIHRREVLIEFPLDILSVGLSELILALAECISAAFFFAGGSFLRNHTLCLHSYK